MVIFYTTGSSFHLAPSLCESVQLDHCKAQPRRNGPLNTLTSKKMHYFHLTGVLWVSPRLPLTFSNRSVLGVSLRGKHIRLLQLKPMHLSWTPPSGDNVKHQLLLTPESEKLVHIHDRLQHVRGQIREWEEDKHSMLCNKTLKSSIHLAPPLVEDVF